MKSLLILLLAVVYFSIGYAQDTAKINLHSKLIGKDSVILFFNKNYEVVDPTCADIIRYGHYDIVHRCCIGKFKDVNKKDTSVILADGEYTTHGFKIGLFTAKYLAGQLQAKGSFKNGYYEGDWVVYYPNGNLACKGNFINNVYNGNWEFYYEDGKPNIFFEAVNGQLNILSAWSTSGKKITNNGNGDYSIQNGGILWNGRLKNGFPDGEWQFKNGTSTGTEVFKNGQFVKGTNNSSIVIGTKEYTDHSRINLLPQFPSPTIFNAERLNISLSDCESTKKYAKKEGTSTIQIFDITK